MYEFESDSTKAYEEQIGERLSSGESKYLAEELAEELFEQNDRLSELKLDMSRLEDEINHLREAVEYILEA